MTTEEVLKRYYSKCGLKRGLKIYLFQYNQELSILYVKIIAEKVSTLLALHSH